MQLDNSSTCTCIQLTYSPAPDFNFAGGKSVDILLCLKCAGHVCVCVCMCVYVYACVCMCGSA